MNKKFLIAALAVTVITAAAGTYTIKRAYADDSNGRFGPFLQGLIERFNLNEDEVQSYMDEQRTARQEERQQDLNDRLDQYVSDGVLTQEQKDSLLQLMEEHQADMENSDLSFEDMHNLMDEHRDELQAWADENGVDISELRLGWGPHDGGPRGDFDGDGDGFGAMGGMGHKGMSGYNN